MVSCCSTLPACALFVLTPTGPLKQGFVTDDAAGLLIAVSQRGGQLNMNIRHDSAHLLLP